MKNLSLLLIAIFWMTGLFAQETEEEFTQNNLKLTLLQWTVLKKALRINMAP
jgi:hypothetical protein